MKRGRKPGIDPKKAGIIIEALISNPDGLWLRQIAAMTRLHPSTVSKYAETALKPLLDEESLGNEGKPIIRVIKLKPYVIDQLHQGKPISEIIRIINVINENR